MFFNLVLLNPVAEILMQPFFCENNILYGRFDISEKTGVDMCFSYKRYFLLCFAGVTYLDNLDKRCTALINLHYMLYFLH